MTFQIKISYKTEISAIYLRIMLVRNKNENLLIAGDFNAVEDINKDIFTTSKNQIVKNTDNT